MHLLVEAGVDVCFDGNVVGLSVRDVPEGLHSILTADRKFLVFTRQGQSLVEVNKHAKFVSLLSVVSCVYPERSDWRDLTNLVSQRTFERCLSMSLCDIDTSVQTDLMVMHIKTLDFIEIDDDSLFTFTHIPTHSALTQLIPTTNTSTTPLISQTTIQALNKSHLNAFLTLHHILEELQLAFVLFSIYQSESAFDTFKTHLFHLTHIDCFKTLPPNCNIEHSGDTRVMEVERVIDPLFVKLCTALAKILKCFPADFFRDPLSSGSFLEECLRNLYVNMEGVKYVEVLAGVVEDLFMWNMRVLEDDELPTIVNEDG